MTDGYEGDEIRHQDNRIADERIRRTVVDRHLEERSLSSDDTVFLDLPLPPVPDRAVEVLNVDLGDPTVVAVAALMYARMDDFDVAPPRQSDEQDSLSSRSSGDRNSPNGHMGDESRDTDDYTPHQSSTEQLNEEMGGQCWSTSDEESSFYRERMSMFRSESLTPHIFGHSPRTRHRSGECLVSGCGDVGG